jgi:hypothetical protein
VLAALALLLALAAAPAGASARGGTPPAPEAEEEVPPPAGADEDPAAAADDPAPAPEGAEEPAREEEPPADAEAEAEVVPPPPPPPPDAREAEADQDKDESWLDAGHAFVEHRLFAPVLRVDRFFSDERDLDLERSRSFLRWRNALRFVEGRSTPRYTTSLSANLRLPGLNKQLRRMRIEIAGETRDAFSAIFPRDNVAPGDVHAPDESVGTADAGVRFHLWDTVRTHGDVGAGVLVRLPPGVYTRLRFRFAQPLARRFLAREAISGFYRTDTGFGTTGSADLERPLARTVLVRLTGTTTVTEVSRGFEWLGDLSLLATIRSRVGVQLGAAITGATDALTLVDSYRVYTRVRRDFYRRWLFLEVEPELSWPWAPDRGRFQQWGVILRLEVQFQGNERPPPEPPPPPPEPVDPPPPGG